MIMVVVVVVESIFLVNVTTVDPITTVHWLHDHWQLIGVFRVVENFFQQQFGACALVLIL